DHIVWTIMSPDDSIIATSAFDSTVRIWNSTNGEELQVLTFEVWSIEREELLHAFEGHRTPGNRVPVAFSPNGRSLATGSSGFGSDTLKVFDLLSGEEKQILEVMALGTETDFHGVRVIYMHYTPKGLLVFKLDDGTVSTYDEETDQ
ncbi:hypothetical protein K435DRAFT_619186, partial [Dendrothele bispora CBS 962.96]